MLTQSAKKSFVWAHRGRNRLAPENTMAAFLTAFKAGDPGIELDVALTSDMVPVVIHDDTVDRTTDGSGLVGMMDFCAIRQLDAGSWFDDVFTGERIPSLEEVLQAARAANYPVRVNIEIKRSAWNVDPALSVEKPILELIRESGMSSRVLISSFEWRSLRRMKMLASGIPLGVLTEFRSNPEDVIREARDLDAFSIHPDIRDVLEGLPDAYSRFNGCIYPYTVRDEESGKRIIIAGSDGYFADLPF